jgi:2-(1,2-epoxy-1,2-dihydrophenyl)acetyl-CoA isomerase
MRKRRDIMAEQPYSPEEMKTTTWLVEKKDHIGILTLNRPEKLNANMINPEHSPHVLNDREEEWGKRFAEVKLDPDVHVVIFTGAGKAFCVGADMKAWGARSADELRTGKRRITPTVVTEGTTLPHEWITRMKKPTIAMVNGLAVGEGADIALACDIRIMSDQAWFWWAYIERGMIPMDGACWLLPRIVGKAKAMEILLTGRRVYPDEALRIGLANMVVPHDQLRDTTMEMAEKIASLPKESIQLTRFAIDAGMNQAFRHISSLLC